MAEQTNVVSYPQKIIVVESPRRIQVVGNAPGPQGDPGPQGEPGPAGPNTTLEGLTNVSDTGANDGEMLAWDLSSGLWVPVPADFVAKSGDTMSGILRITGGTDVDNNNGTGFLILGQDSGANMALDTNEIQAKNNGSVSTLNLNVLGGNVVVGSSSSSVSIQGMGFQTSGAAPSGQQILRSHTNGYSYFGWINTVSGARTSATTPVRIYASDDAFLRYYSPADLGTAVAATMFSGNQLRVGSLQFSNNDYLTYNDTTNVFEFTGDGTTNLLVQRIVANANLAGKTRDYAALVVGGAGSQANLYFDTTSNDIQLRTDSASTILYVRNGTDTGFATVQGILSNQSSRRYKRGIKPSSTLLLLEQLLLLEPVTFHHCTKDDTPPEEVKDTAPEFGETLGLIAEDVGKVAPRVAFWGDGPENETEATGISDIGLSTLVVGAVQELYSQFTDEIADLKNRVESLERRGNRV